MLAACFFVYSDGAPKLNLAVSEKVRIFAVDKSTEYHGVISEETTTVALRAVQTPLK
jgi:hypothetical protein